MMHEADRLVSLSNGTSVVYDDIPGLKIESEEPSCHS